MRVTRLLAVTAVAACGNAAKGPPQPAAKPMLTWKDVDPRGRDWEEKVASIPAEERQRLAQQLLRDRGFDCRSMISADGCGPTVEKLAVTQPSDDLESPCLRREIALWAVDQLDVEGLSSVRDEILMLLRPIESERDANRRIFAKLLGADETTRVAAVRAMDRSMESELRLDDVHDFDDESLITLACDGIDVAVVALLARDVMPPTYAGRDDCRMYNRLRRETLLQMVEASSKQGDPLDPDTDDDYAARKIRSLYFNEDCVVARAALLASGDEIFDGLVDRKRWQFRACIRLLDQKDVRDLISPEGLTIAYDRDHVNDDTRDLRYREKRAVDDAFELPFVDELVLALPRCEKSTCPVPGTQISFQLTFDAKDRLEVIERIERAGACN